MKRFYTVILIVFIAMVSVSAQTSLEGKMRDKETGEPILFGTVALYKNGILITGAESDIDGNYYVSDIEPGTYDVEAKYLGYSDMKTTGVLLKAGQTIRLNFDMVVSGIILEEAIVTAYRNPLVNVDNTTTGTVISSDKINTLPVKGLNSIIATAAGVATQDGSTPSIRGSRSNETIYIIDGIRTFGNVPQSEIDQLQIVTGGIEAKYGDVTGGIISITTKGPSDKISGGFDIETSEFLDGYGYNLGMGYLTGPILKNKKGQTVLGYRLSGQYRDIAEGSPSAVGVYRVPENIINELEANPLYTLGNVRLPAAERLRTSDIGSPLRVRPNTGDKDVNLVAKIDAQLGKGLDLSLSGNYQSSKNQFSPGGGWDYLNWTHNPFQLTDRYRVNFRLRHKLGTQTFDPTKSQGNVKKSPLQNFSYTLQGGYEKGRNSAEDLIHGDNIFNYGYFGSRNVNWSPFFGFDIDPVSQTVDFRHLGYTQIEGEFVPGNYNPTLAQFNDENGLLNPDFNNVWNNLFQNPGQVYNSFNKGESDLVTLNITSGFDFLPGGSEKGRHNIQLGFTYEQRVNRAYSIAPRRLWRIADLLVNNHIKGIDPTNVLRDTSVFNPLLQANVDLPIYQTLIQTSPEDKFYRTIREKLGVGINEFVNIDGIDPSFLSLDMFSPKELADESLISYYGYDYLGNKLTGTSSFDDFFRKRNADGTRTFDVAPFTPIYMAGFLQDKFSYKDIIFRLGVRVDYYDANTKVLKDPYSLYEIETAKQFYERTGRTRPESVGEDYAVYVTGEESDEVVGFRQGDQWFSPNGTSVTSGSSIFNGGIVYPAYVGRTASGNTPARVLSIQDPDFDINTSFTDYKPQFNVMPRLAFSFPISEDAGFFAHYDVLYQRPQSNVIMTPLDYFYFENIGSTGPANNPDLKPVRTIDYEVGFQQKISENASLKLSGYQKEMKDLIQNRVYAFIPAPINNYEAYGNLDFGNVTGFTFQFDRRRTSNLELNLTYTLQFANGSGSDANSSRNINTRGPIRNLIPLSFDERHRVTGVFDYRYGSGKQYNGPVVGGMKILQDAGVTLTTIAVSGRPYTRNQIPSQYGGTGFLGEINGARLPWNFNIDLRADKRFSIKPTKEARPLYANLYFRVQNLLNTKNISGVYGATGSPNNDGYLLSELGQDRVNDVANTGRGVEAFLDAYNWALLSPGNYFLPRRMYLGLTFDF